MSLATAQVCHGGLGTPGAREARARSESLGDALSAGHGARADRDEGRFTGDSSTAGAVRVRFLPHPRGCDGAKVGMMRRTLSVSLWAAMLALPLAARANPGDLDPSFGTGGQAISPILSGYDVACALVLQPDGKLVAAGHAYNANNNTLALVRYNADGSLDRSFGTGGKVYNGSGDAKGGCEAGCRPG